MISTSVLTIIIILSIIVIILFSERSYAHENFTNDEALQNIASLYNSGLATVTNLNATTSIKTPQLNSDGRLNVSGNGKLYLLNKNGVVISKDDGGNGNLSVQGDANVAGTSTTNQLMANKITAHSDILTNRITSNVDISTGDLNVRGRAIFRNIPGVAAVGGWDVNRPGDGTTTNITACAQWCRNNNQNAVSAGYYKPNKSCYCKNLAATGSIDPNWDMALFF